MTLAINDLSASHQIVNKLYIEQSLYPQAKPFNDGHLEVSDGHSIYFAEFGNPSGIPVITSHGGPGSQCYEYWTTFFDPAVYRVIMFDQRGAGRSIPFASMENNTPQHSVEDMELLRHHLKVDKWILFGGSYGSFLSILYGETHPENCLGFVLRGIFLCREHDYKHLFYGMKTTYPEAWDDMVEIIPEDERHDLITAFHKRIMDPDPVIHLEVARAFMRFDTICASLLPNRENIETKVNTDMISTLGVGRAFIHYAANAFFVEENQLLNDLSKIAHLPAIIVQGRYDVICPPQGAYDLYQKWPRSELWYISNAGHASSEPGISQGLREALDQIQQEINWSLSR
jgi:proline iminopeptidase